MIRRYLYELWQTSHHNTYEITRLEKLGQRASRWVCDVLDAPMQRVRNRKHGFPEGGRKLLSYSGHNINYRVAFANGQVLGHRLSQFDISY